jgi:hypothetical protein
VHVPDLPLYPGSDSRYGFGLWQLKTVELVIELLLYAAGVLLYYRSTKAINKTGKYAAATLLIFLPVVHLLNQFGPPPPTVSAVAWAGQLQWLIVAWAYWADSGRTANEPEKSSRSATIKTIQQKKPV